MKKKYLLLGFFVFCGLFVASLFCWPLVNNEGGKQYILKPGTSIKMFVTEMSQQGIVDHPWLLSIYSYLQPHKMLKTGEYQFPKGSTARTIWHQVTEGTGLVYHSFTVVPGWSFAQLRHELAATQNLRPVTADFSDKDIMRYLGYTHLPSPEGQFFPETYYYTRSNPDLIILKRSIDLMQSRLRDAWENRAKNLPYKTMYEALIAASMIEKEAYLDAERPVIASVLVNRLQKNMLLQFDPTIIYGLGSRYTGKISKDNLLENTPYNTYLHKGLPPTPIAIPSMRSINAALHPQNTRYLYFVAKGDGSHQFSVSLDEHHIAVLKNANSLEAKSPFVKPKRHDDFFNDALVKAYLRLK